MSLSPGTRIGTYEITAALGAGGMGEVYRAKDSRLKREVALKVLPADVANDRERMARFQREAEVLAALNHPNIAAIYGIEEGPAEAGHHIGADVASGFSRHPPAASRRLARGRHWPRLPPWRCWHLPPLFINGRRASRRPRRSCGSDTPSPRAKRSRSIAA